MRTLGVALAFLMVVALMVTGAMAQSKSLTQDQEVAKLLEALSRQDHTKPQAESSDKNPSPTARESGPTIREIYRAAYTDAERAAAGLDFDNSLKALKHRLEEGNTDLDRELSGIPEAGAEQPPEPGSDKRVDSSAGRDTQNLANPNRDQPVESAGDNKGPATPSPTIPEPTGGRKGQQVNVGHEENPLDTLWTRVVQLAERVTRLESAMGTNGDPTELGK